MKKFKKKGGVNDVNEHYQNRRITVAQAILKSNKAKVAEKINMAMELLDDVSITPLTKTTLMYHRSTSGLNTTITTNDGVVKLEGHVKNAAEKELATKLVSDVHGVKGVVNTMTIN
jgi:hyperosmotically inducible periplasmic protein